jgi:hypothetical protein
MKRVAGVLAVFLAGLLMPATASAQWFVNPYLGSISKINFSEPHTDSPSVWGIAGGAGAMKFIGGEADYTVAKEFSGLESEIGENRLRMVTGAVHGGYPIKIGGRTRIRPYGSFGGGLGILDQGLEFFADYNAINNLPFQQQQAIYNCLGKFDDPTPSQIQSCGVGVLSEPGETGYFGALSVGGGVFGFIVSHVGVRADFRYYWQVPSDEEPFNYWRYTFGVVIH